jgi:hypothetical protein
MKGRLRGFGLEQRPPERLEVRLSHRLPGASPRLPRPLGVDTEGETVCHDGGRVEEDVEDLRSSGKMGHVWSPVAVVDDCRVNL